MDFRIGSSELVREEFTLGITNQLDEGHDHPPRMWSVAQDAFKKNFCDNFLECLILDLCEQVEEQRAEPERVETWEAKV
jgi:hypothetical protein